MLGCLFDICNYTSIIGEFVLHCTYTLLPLGSVSQSRPTNHVVSPNITMNTATTSTTNNMSNMTSKRRPTEVSPQSRPYRSRGERYLATAITGLFNLTVGFLSLQGFVRFQEVYESNVRCREHWPKLVRHVHHADSQLFSVFYSKAALRWVLLKGINATDWKLQLTNFSTEYFDYLTGHNGSFIQVCSDGDLDIVKAMVERTQVHLEARDVEGYTPLHQAAQQGYLSVVQYLCEQGADKEARTTAGYTPLHQAAQQGYLSVVQYLCEQGADKEARTIGGRTPLHRAALYDHLPTVQYLCEQGADKDATRIRLSTGLSVV